MEETIFTWGIAQLERESTDGYVYTVHWTLLAQDGDHTASAYGSLGLERPEDEMIPFEDLTKEIVIDWIEEKLEEDQIESMKQSLQSQIDEKKSPTKLSGLPW
jgi:hypothetical protein